MVDIFLLYRMLAPAFAPSAPAVQSPVGKAAVYAFNGAVETVRYTLNANSTRLAIHVS